MMLFGEKYGEFVRVITFDKDFSQELCGGTHVDATGEIGYFKILAESGVAAGIRRIEAITGDKAQSYINKELDELNNVRALLKNPKSVVKSVESLQEENKSLKKELEQLLAQQANALKGQLLGQVEEVNGVQLLATKLPLNDTAAIKNLAYQLEKEIENAVIIFGAEVKGKPQLMVVVNKALSEGGKYHAGNMIRELAKEIKGGGGGQPFFATAGGKDVSGLDAAIAKAKTLIA
jgi:alanyl-tRNA synthetase